MDRRSFMKGAAAAAAIAPVAAVAGPVPAIDVHRLSAISARLAPITAGGVWGEGSAALLGGSSWLLKNARGPSL